MLYEVYKLSADPKFRARVETAMVAVALKIVGENPEKPNTSKRQTLGLRVLGRERHDLVGHFALAVTVARPSLATTAVNSGVDAIRDEDVLELVDQVWNYLAGVTSA